MAVIEATCVHCSSNNRVKNGKSLTGEQRYKCRVLQCEKTVISTFGKCL
ncbi:IS1 family transposase [Legionella santicrucis]